MFKLVIQDDEGKTTVVPLIRDEITIGRKEGNTIRLTERNVSRRHARILRSDNDVQIEDLGSYNGIRVNNARIAERVSLRISDQVQIGDYKLYLKAEGADQSDDARTVPIERLDTPPAVAAVTPTSQAPTTQLPAQPRPQAVPAQVGVADTDPAGRPVATASQVAAMTAPAAYGRFVIISSNLAGKELLLTRPQMTIGRANADLIIEHRSISRHHAKITRDPETQRYTITDLSSANGVKVNGQGYGKVELRRADVVDLGHVKLRFVEAGEDFAFTRDMVINVSETGKSGTLVGVVLGVVVLGAVAAFFALHGGGGGDKTAKTGSAAAIVTPVQTGSAQPQIIAPVVVDAGLAGVPLGSSSDSPELKRLEGDCLQDITGRNWSGLATCADQLDGIKAGAGQPYHDKTKLELGAERDYDHMQSALKDNDLKGSQKLLDKIPTDSVYHDDAQKQFTTKRAAIVGQGITQARGYAQHHKCAELDRFVQQESASLGEEVGQEIRDNVKCDAATAQNPTTNNSTTQQTSSSPDCSQAMVAPKDPHCKQQFCESHMTAAACVDSSASGPNCDQLSKDAMSAMGGGDNTGALKLFEKAYLCKPDARTLQLAFMTACNATNVPRARFWWKRLSSEEQNKYVQMCVRRNITRDQLEGP